jgi:hypothetical protein
MDMTMTLPIDTRTRGCSKCCAACEHWHRYHKFAAVGRCWLSPSWLRVMPDDGTCKFFQEARDDRTDTTRR